MKLLVVSDSHILKDANGKYWCNTAVHGYEFWTRYLEVFDEVHVLSRVQELKDNDTSKLIRADGEGVKIIDLRFIRGFNGYVKNILSFSKAIKNSIKDEDVAIFRVPSLPAYIALHFFKKLHKEYALEVIVDPVDAYKSNRLAQILFTYITKKECKKAKGVSYVTQFFLQKKYPCKAVLLGENSEYYTSYYSSINLRKDFFGVSKKYKETNDIKIIHVASAINSDVKGHSTLIKIVEKLTNKGYNVQCNCIGDGLAVEQYKRIIKEKKLEEKINFLGLFSDKNDLRNLLLESDICVFPSRAEGLPRALIEAMATGLPCLSTTVNGIPELIDEKYLFDPDDVEGFVDKIMHLLSNPNELEEMSSKNIQKAEEYLNEKLAVRRNEFYSKLKDSAS